MMLWSVRVMAALLVAGTAAAQSPGAFFLGTYGQWTHFDSKWKLDSGFGNTLGIGFRAGAFVSPNWSIEADGSYTPAASTEGTSFLGSRTNGVGGNVKASSLTGRVLYSFSSATQRSFHVGGGAVLENFRGDLDTRAAVYGYGVNALAGMSFSGRYLGARVDGFMNYIPSNGIRLDLGIQAGVQLLPQMFGATAANAPSGGGIVLWDDLDSPLPGTMEIGGSLMRSHFDDNPGQVSPKSGNFGYVGHVGVFLPYPRWELEFDGYYSPQDVRVPIGGFSTAARPTEANASAFAARMNYNAPIATGQILEHESSLVIGVGLVRTNYKFMGGTGLRNINETFTYNYGMSGLAGFRFGIANRTAIRLDGVADWMPNHEPANVNLHLRVGLSVLLGGARTEARCPFPGLGNVSAVSPQCVAPVAPVTPPPPPPPPPGDSNL